MTRRLAALAGALFTASALLMACDGSPDAPTDLGVCWRVDTSPSGGVSFQPLLRGAGNLESCAATLEGAAMKARQTSLTGAYQGQFVFITPDMVQSGTRLNGARYRLFDAATRGKIDQQLRWKIDDERHPSEFGPKPASAP